MITNIERELLVESATKVVCTFAANQPITPLENRIYDSALQTLELFYMLRQSMNTKKPK